MPSILDHRSLTSAKLRMRLRNRPSQPPAPSAAPAPSAPPAPPFSSSSSTSPPPPPPPPPSVSPRLLPSSLSPCLPSCRASDAKSCPLLPVDVTMEQPGLLKRATHPVYKLPPLNLSNLSEPCVDDLRTARRRVDNFSTSLSKFRPYLYVASDVPVRDMAILKRAGVTHVVNLAGRASANWFPSELHYFKLLIRDDEGEDMMPVVRAVASFIDEAREQGGVVAVHCKQGISRSVTVALSYVMMREGLPLDEAMRQMRVCRPIANPNSGFWALLGDIEKWIRGEAQDTFMVVRRLGGGQVWGGARVHKAPHINHADAYVVCRGRRQGVVVWRGNECAEEVWMHALVIARDVAKQEDVDARRNGGKAGGVRLLQQGENTSFDHQIRLAVMS